MPKAPRHRKRTRTARIESNPTHVAVVVPVDGGSGSSFATGSNSHIAGSVSKKIGKKELEVTNLLSKLISIQDEDRIQASVRSFLDNQSLT
jgi:hypothetical protein